MGHSRKTIHYRKKDKMRTVTPTRKDELAPLADRLTIHINERLNANGALSEGDRQIVRELVMLRLEMGLFV